MLISASPVAIPVTTAHIPTESVASEAARKLPVPETQSTSEHAPTKNSTEGQDSVRHQPEFSKELQRQSREDNSSDGEQSRSSGEEGRREEQGKGQSSNRQDREQQRQELLEIEQLKARDREVRAHEAAHAAAGGQLAGSPSYTFTTGPNGVRYATAGEVSIDTSRVSSDPQATVRKMQQVRQAALAPASPSAQDLKVAAIASQVASQAQIELNSERNQKPVGEVGKHTVFGENDDAEESNRANRQIRFANPVVAERSRLRLNQKIIQSGAFDSQEEQARLSRYA